MNTAKDLVLICVFAALMAALGVVPPLYLSIGVPITAQSLGPMLAGGILGARRGSLSQSLFLFLVAIGLPLLAGNRGGLGVFAGPTVGYLISWPIVALATGFWIERSWNNLNLIRVTVCCAICGIGIVYLIGMPVFSIITGTPLTTVLIGSLAFLPGDIAKVLIASLTIVMAKKSYPLIHTARK